MIPRLYSDSAIFLVFEKGYSRDASTDFDAKYVNRRGSAQESVFWESRNENLRFGPNFPKKTPFLGTISAGEIGVGDAKNVIVFDPLLTVT